MNFVGFVSRFFKGMHASNLRFSATMSPEPVTLLVV